MSAPHPGKYQAHDSQETADRAADYYENGDPSESIGSVDELGWYGLYLEDSGGAILTEDSNGFVVMEEFATDLEINDRWHEIEHMYSEWYADDEYDEPEHVTDDKRKQGSDPR